jgi:DnaJ-domain-containing protein 1
MTAVALVALGALLAFAAVYAARGAPPPSPRAVAGAALMLAALGLAALRQFAVAVPAGLLALELLRRAAAEAAATPAPGQVSEVRTDALAMSLDHDSGRMDGEVLAGRFTGAYLSQLSEAELEALADELADDHDSLGLLLAYRERRRGSGAEAEGGGAGAPPPGDDGRGMSAAEALRILGLQQGASLEEIRAAHRRLMKKVHPDLGGSDALAAMINAAKARLDP